MMKQKPQIIVDVGFDFSWDNAKVWALDVPVEQMSMIDLLWHFDIPFLSSGPGGYYDVKPQEIIDSPEKHPQEYQRMLAADTSYPIDIMFWRGKWLILDGLHRLMQQANEGAHTVRVRKISEQDIPKIKKI